MNASGVFLLFVAAVVVAFASGLPALGNAERDGLESAAGEKVEDLDVWDFEKSGQEGKNEVRTRRATCDLLSISTSFGSLNHAACAAHCLAKRKGFKGGRCKSGVCHCRK